MTFIFAGNKFPFLVSEVHSELQPDLFASKGMKVFMKKKKKMSTFNYLVLSRAKQQSCDLVIVILYVSIHSS